MSTEPLFFYEHVPTKTILRSMNSGGMLQVIRDFQEIARFSMHLNYSPSCSENGIVYFHDSYGRRTLDLNLPFPQEPQKAINGDLIHPNGKYIIHYAMKEYPYKFKDKSYAGLLFIDRRTAEPEVLWNGDTSNPELVPVFGQTLEEASKREPYDDVWKKIEKPIEFPRILFDSESKIWALLQNYRLVIGKEDKLLSSVFWNKYTFFPIKAEFDLKKERLLLLGSHGILAFSFAGNLDAYWKANLVCEPYEEYGEILTEKESPLVSPPLILDREIWVIAATHKAEYGSPSCYEVLKFNRDDLTFLGQHKGFPPKRDPDENAILYALSDGSIAWVPNTLPIEILPAEGSHLTSTEIVKIIGEAKEPIVPHPSDSWYLHSIGETGELPDIIQASPEERKSLARYLLNELMEDRRFTQLIEIDVSAFQPYISQIVEWKEDRLNLLREMDWQNFWKIMYGLPDSSVQKIAKKLGTKKKLKNSDKNYIQLLIGAGTTLALETLGELARKHSLASELCSDFLLEVLESGPAIPRVSRTSHDIIAYPDTENENQEGIFYPLRHSEYLPEKFGWTCRSSMGHILSIDLELLKVNSLMSSSLKLHHWFLSTGEECCDESICTYYAYRNIKGSHQLIQLIADLASANPKERPEQTDCEGSETEDRQTKKYKIVLESHIPDRPWKVKTLGKLGGYPDWWQSPEIPSCPDCGRMMFYIGYVKADSIRDDMIDAALYGFHCEDCGIGAQVVQIT